MLRNIKTFYLCVKAVSTQKITMLYIANHSLTLHYLAMREILVYGISGCASLFILGYTVRIFIGGLVSAQTEMISIIAVVSLGAAVVAWMAWDILRDRRNQ